MSCSPQSPISVTVPPHVRLKASFLSLQQMIRFQIIEWKEGLLQRGWCNKEQSVVISTAPKVDHHWPRICAISNYTHAEAYGQGD